VRPGSKLGRKAHNADEQLVLSFFLTYRRFSTPLDLMREFQIRFEEVAAATLAKDLKMVVLQR
jgi:hypothetical protein